jgi:hypothetical protein
MDNFEKYLDKIFAEADDGKKNLSDFRDDPDKLVKYMEAYKLATEADEHQKTEEAKRQKMNAETENIGKLCAKDIITALPGIIGAAVGIAGLASSIHQTKYRCATDLAIEQTKASNRRSLVDILTRKNNDDIIVDKPMKVYNDISKDD